jgi:signal peptidase II
MMRRYFVFGVTLGVLVLDQITKGIIQSTMNLYDSFSVLGDFFRITYVENPGMAFGIQFGDNTFFTVFAIIASIAILIYMFQMKGEHAIARLAMALILGGALGNLLDRLTRGRVVDFLDFEFFNVRIPEFQFLFLDFPGYAMNRWPIFNVADMGVSIGMIILIVFIILDKEHHESDSQTDSNGMIH